MASKDEIRRVSIYINGTDADATLRQLQNGSRRLYNELANLVPGTDAFRERAMRLREVNAVLTDIQQDIRGIGGAFEEIKRIAEGVSIGTLVSKSIETALEAVNEFIAGSEAAYDEAQRTQTQLAAAIKSTGGVAGESIEKLQNYQETLMEQTGVDDDVIAKGQEMLLTFTNIRGYIFDQATPAIVDMTAAMNGGKVTMEGIQKTAIQVGKALQDPIAGVTSLQKVGVRLDEQQKQQIKTLVESNHMMDAQAIILKELQKEFGGVAKAIADTDVGKLQQFETDMGNLQEKIGGFITEGKAALAEFFDPLVKNLAETGTMAEKLTKEFEGQKDAVNHLEKDTTPLINRYDELKAKSSLNKTEQAELNAIINTLSQTIPTAVTQWDKYGNALGINTAKAREFIQMQKEVMKVQNADAIQAQFDKLVDLEGRSQRIQAELAAGTVATVTRGGSVDNLTASTRALTDDEIRKNVAELKKIQEQIKAASLAIKGLKGENIVVPKGDTFTPPTSGKTAEQLAAEQRAAEERKRQLAEYEAAQLALKNKLKEFNASELADTLAKNDKEVAALENKYNKEWTEATAAMKKLRASKFANDADLDKQQQVIDGLAAQKQKAVTDLRARQEKELVDKISAFRDQMAGKLATELQKETDQINAYYDGLKRDAGNNQDQLATIEANRTQALTDAKLREEKRFQDEKDKINAEGAVTEADKDAVELARINKKYDEEIQALKKNYSEQLKAKQTFEDALAQIEKNRANEIKQRTDKKDEDERKKIKDAAIQSAQSISDAVFTIGKQNRDAETNAKISALEKQKEAELANKNLTEAQKNAINEKYAKQEAAIKLQAWKADRDAALTQAVINGALAVIKALPNLFAAGAAGVAALAQVAIIKSQKPPQFADGGYSAVDYSDPSGWVKRPTLFTRSASGRPFIAGEGYRSEYIISSAQLRDPVVANFVGMMEGNRLRRQFENGGYTSTATTAPAPAPAYPVAPDHSARLDRIEAAIDKLHAIVKAEAEKPVVWSYQTAQRETDKLVQITNKASGK